MKSAGGGGRGDSDTATGVELSGVLLLQGHKYTHCVYTCYVDTSSVQHVHILDKDPLRVFYVKDWTRGTPRAILCFETTA